MQCSPSDSSGPAVVVELAAGPARAGVAHAPEVLLVALRDIAPAHQPLRRKADLIGPDAVGLVVIGVDRGGHPVRRQAELLGEVFPGPMDGVALEVVAKAPVAQHLEQGVVARRPADLLEVVVLAGHAQAGLRVDRAHVVALLLAGQHALEGSHPGVDEQERGIVARQQGGSGHAGMPALLEEALVALADLRRRHWLQRVHILTRSVSPQEPAPTGSSTAWLRWQRPVRLRPPARPRPATQPRPQPGQRHRTRPSSRREPSRRPRGPR